jgi:hypothetical protein
MNDGRGLTVGVNGEQGGMLACMGRDLADWRPRLGECGTWALIANVSSEGACTGGRWQGVWPRCEFESRVPHTRTNTERIGDRILPFL